MKNDVYSFFIFKDSNLICFTKQRLAFVFRKFPTTLRNHWRLGWTTWFKELISSPDGLKQLSWHVTHLPRHARPSLLVQARLLPRRRHHMACLGLPTCLVHSGSQLSFSRKVSASWLCQFSRELYVHSSELAISQSSRGLGLVACSEGQKINNMPNMASRKFSYIPKVICAAWNATIIIRHLLIYI
jgi:hypothetical protein